MPDVSFLPPVRAPTKRLQDVASVWSCTRTAQRAMAEPNSVYEVLSDRYEWVNVRAGPAMNAAKLGQKRRGATVAVDLCCGGSDDNWVRTVETFGAEQRPGWLLVDGTPHGLGMRPCRNQAGSAFGQLALLSAMPCTRLHRPAPANWQMGRRNAGRSDIRPST